MGDRSIALVVLALLAALVVAVSGHQWADDVETGHRERSEWFMLQKSKHVVKTDAGNVRVVKNFRSRFVNSPIHIGFITMEPRSLFVPQYLDSSLILFVRSGEARVGHIHKDELVERTLKVGDIYRIESGSAFYFVNTAESHRLQVICSIDTSDSFTSHPFQPFYIGGGRYPTSLLSGFDSQTLSTAFNVSEAELGKMLTRQREGPIMYLSNSHSHSAWSKFLDMEQNQKLAQMRRMIQIREEDLEKEEKEEEDEQPTWFFRKLLRSVFGEVEKRTEDKKVKIESGPNAYNIYEKTHDHENNYGWSVHVDESDFSPLTHDDVSVFIVNITAGSMTAPLMNPRATQYAIVLSGSGIVQIVYPNGSLAMKAKVKEGDVFWVPRYFAFCEVASRTSGLELFGFTTSARNNRPQSLVGANSMLHKMRGPELAAAFGLSDERLNQIVDAQHESNFLPWAQIPPPKEQKTRMEMEKKGETGKVIGSFGYDMVMGFD